MSDCQLRARKKPKKARIESCGDESDRAGLENAQMGTARSGAGYSRTKKSESFPRAPSARRTHGSIRAFLSFFRARSWQSLPCAGTLLYCLLRSRKRPKKARIESCGAESNRAGLKNAQIRTTRSGAGYSRIKKSGSLPRAPSPRRIHGSIRAFFGFFRARSWQSLPCAGTLLDQLDRRHARHRSRGHHGSRKRLRQRRRIGEQRKDSEERRPRSAHSGDGRAHRPQLRDDRSDLRLMLGHDHLEVVDDVLVQRLSRRQLRHRDETRRRHVRLPRCCHPFVGIRRRHDESRKHEKDCALGECRKREHSLAAAPCERERLGAREIRHVGAKRHRDAEELRLADRARRERVERAQYRAGIRAPAAESSANRNALLDLDLEAARPTRRIAVRDRSAIGEILLLRSDLDSVDDHQALLVARANRDRVGERDAREECLDRVVAAALASEDAKPEVELRLRRHARDLRAHPGAGTSAACSDVAFMSLSLSPSVTK